LFLNILLETAWLCDLLLKSYSALKFVRFFLDHPVFRTPMARYSLFVLKVLLNANQPPVITPDALLFQNGSFNNNNNNNNKLHRHMIFNSSSSRSLSDHRTTSLCLQWRPGGPPCPTAKHQVPSPYTSKEHGTNWMKEWPGRMPSLTSTEPDCLQHHRHTQETG